VLIGITRVRNEALIIGDTIRHYLERCDRIVLYDDDSWDATVEIAQEVGGDRIEIIRGDTWKVDRRPEETRHRALVLERARQMGADWVLCFDADERLVGDLPDLSRARPNGFTFRLFDGYLTEQVQAPYAGGRLEDLPRMWGPEYRDILILFRVSASRFVGDGNRCPRTEGAIAPAPGVFVKHFGKCLSVEHWEDTCRYYSAEGWPEHYRRKWTKRMGKAIHTTSDRGRALRSWDRLMARPHRWRPL
jgi:glycosyltransferase involved in cell wall biosynthesis